MRIRLSSSFSSFYASLWTKLLEKGPYRSCYILFYLAQIPFLNQNGPIFNLFLFILTILVEFTHQSKALSKLNTNKVKAPLMLVGIGLLYQNHGALLGLAPGVGFLSVLSILKLFEMRDLRDFFVFILIVELSLIGHVLTVDDLYMVGYVLLLSLFLFALLFSFKNLPMDDELNNMKRSIPIWDQERRRIFFFIFLYSIPLMMALFFLFPRLTLGNLFFNTIKKENRTGFSDEVEPGSVSRLAQDSSVYFIAKFSEGKSILAEELYWRGAVLSKNLGFHWKSIKVPEDRNVVLKDLFYNKQINIKKAFFNDDTPLEDLFFRFYKEESWDTFSSEVKGEDASLFEYNVKYNIFGDMPLFLLDPTIAFITHSKSYPLYKGGKTVRVFPHSNQKISYSGVFYRAQKKFNKEFIEDDKEIYLQLPPLSKRVQFTKWVQEQKLGMGDLKSAIRVFRDYLGRNQFRYSLEPGTLDEEAPLDEFFFERKVGFCEHFSSALATYLRLLGFPTRLVTGFQGGKFNPLGGFYVVRGMDAHAWVEVFDGGWKRIDPTLWVAPARIKLGADIFGLGENFQEEQELSLLMNNSDNGFFGRLRFAFEVLYFEANQKFINFDIEEQKRLLPLLDKLKFLGGGIVRNLLIILVVFLLLCFLFLNYWLTRNQSRSKVTRSYEELLNILLKGNVAVTHSQPPTVNGALAIKKYPKKKRQIERVFSRIDKFFYGRGVKESDLLQHMELLKSDLKKRV